MTNQSALVESFGVMKKTAVIIPCYNEEKRLKEGEFLRSTAENSSLHFVFVNDGSTDNTAEKIAHLCSANPEQLKGLTLEKNEGKAEAVRRGVLWAIGTGFHKIGYWDADLSTPLNVIPRFAELLDSRGLILVLGSRVRLLGRTIKRSELRHYLGRLFATCVSLVLALPVYDTQCGAKMFRNSEALKIAFARPFSVAWTFDVEVLARFLLVEKFRGTDSVKDSAAEYPLEEWVAVGGSKVRPSDFLLGIVELAKLIWIVRGPRTERRFRELCDAASVS